MKNSSRSSGPSNWSRRTRYIPEGAGVRDASEGTTALRDRPGVRRTFPLGAFPPGVFPPGPEPGDRRGEAVFERDRRLPAEHGLRLRHVEHAPLLLTRLRFAVDLLGVPAREPVEVVEERVHVRLDARPDVDDLGVLERQPGHHGADDITHVDVVARLGAGAVDDRLLPGEQALGEDGDHPGLAVRVLSRAVD